MPEPDSHQTTFAFADGRAFGLSEGHQKGMSRIRVWQFDRASPEWKIGMFGRGSGGEIEAVQESLGRDPLDVKMAIESRIFRVELCRVRFQLIEPRLENGPNQHFKSKFC